jgi:hypothetical protein
VSEQEPALIKRMKATEPTPSTVRFWQGEDTYKDVPVPKVRKRWAQILEVADRIVWTHCELLDARNRTLAMLQNDEPASELEDLNEGGMGVSRIGELKQLMEVMGKGQDRVLAHQREEIKAILSATANVVNNLGNAVAVLSKTYERAISVATEGTKMLPAADERTESQKMLEQMAPMIIAALMKGESPEAAARAGAQAAARSAAAEAASKAASGANGAAKAGKA